MKKRITALFLCICMMVIIPIQAGADYDYGDGDYDYGDGDDTPGGTTQGPSNRITLQDLVATSKLEITLNCGTQQMIYREDPLYNCVSWNPYQNVQGVIPNTRISEMNKVIKEFATISYLTITTEAAADVNKSVNTILNVETGLMDGGFMDGSPVERKLEWSETVLTRAALREAVVTLPPADSSLADSFGVDSPLADSSLVDSFPVVFSPVVSSLVDPFKLYLSAPGEITLSKPTAGETMGDLPVPGEITLSKPTAGETMGDDTTERVTTESFNITLQTLNLELVAQDNHTLRDFLNIHGVPNSEQTAVDASSQSTALIIQINTVNGENVQTVSLLKLAGEDAEDAQQNAESSATSTAVLGESESDEMILNDIIIQAQTEEGTVIVWYDLTSTLQNVNDVLEYIPYTVTTLAIPNVGETNSEDFDIMAESLVYSEHLVLSNGTLENIAENAAESQATIIGLSSQNTDSALVTSEMIKNVYDLGVSETLNEYIKNDGTDKVYSTYLAMDKLFNIPVFANVLTEEEYYEMQIALQDYALAVADYLSASHGYENDSISFSELSNAEKQIESYYENCLDIISTAYAENEMDVLEYLSSLKSGIIEARQQEPERDVIELDEVATFSPLTFDRIVDKNLTVNLYSGNSFIQVDAENVSEETENVTINEFLLVPMTQYADSFGVDAKILEYFEFSYSQEGEFGFPITFNLYVGEEHAGQTAVLYIDGMNPVSILIDSRGYAILETSQKLTNGDIFVVSTDDTVREEMSALPFTDVSKDAWYYDFVKYVYEHEILTGDTNTTFDPDGIMTREMIITAIWRQAGEPLVDYPLSYDDVEDDAYYTEAVRWASSLGYLEGVSESSFGIGQPITREELAVLFFGANGSPEIADYEGLAVFSDIEELSLDAQKAMVWAHAQGIITGKTHEILDPQGFATRAEISAMFSRM